MKARPKPRAPPPKPKVLLPPPPPPVPPDFDADVEESEWPEAYGGSWRHTSDWDEHWDDQGAYRHYGARQWDTRDHAWKSHWWHSEWERDEWRSGAAESPYWSKDQGRWEGVDDAQEASHQVVPPTDAEAEGEEHWSSYAVGMSPPPPPPLPPQDEPAAQGDVDEGPQSTGGISGGTGIDDEPDSENVVALLNYCRRLPRDSFTRRWEPEFKDSPNDKGHEVTLKLPTTSNLREEFRSMTCKSISAAKDEVAKMALSRLREEDVPRDEPCAEARAAKMLSREAASGEETITTGEDAQEAASGRLRSTSENPASCATGESNTEDVALEGHAALGAKEPMPVAELPMPFEALHSVDLGDSCFDWSQLKLQVIAIQVRLRLAPNDDSYGLLLGPRDESAQAVDFGLSFEFERGGPDHGVARFTPFGQPWSFGQGDLGPGCPASGADALNLIRMYHQAALGEAFPWLSQAGDFGARRVPTFALLVRLQGLPQDDDDEEDEEDRDSPGRTDAQAMKAMPSLDWLRMRDMVERAKSRARITPQERNVAKMLLEPEQEPTAGESSSAVAGASAGGDSCGMPGMPASSAAVAEQQCAVVLPSWLPTLLRRWFCIRDLQAVAVYHAPVFPVLSPLLLEAALSTPALARMATTTGTKSADLAATLESPQPLTSEALRTLGTCLHRLLLSLSLHVQFPLTDEHKLRELMAAYVAPKELAKSLEATPLPEIAKAMLRAAEQWEPPGMVVQPSKSKLDKLSEDALADISHALIATCFLSEGGGFCSSWQIWRWLVQQVPGAIGARKSLNEDPEHSSAVAEKIDKEKRDEKAVKDSAASGAEPLVTLAHGQGRSFHDAVLGHHILGNHHHFRGRTPSYHEMQVAVEEDGAEVLRVSYENGKVYDYRRAQPTSGNTKPQERLVELEGDKVVSHEWGSLMYSHAHRTMVSAWMREENDEHKPRPLPNKVTAWIRGRPLASLTTVKHYAGRTPGYLRLKESVLRNELRVLYDKDQSTERSRWYIYRRDEAGGLGWEEGPFDSATCFNSANSKGAAVQRPLKYSESRKTLTSASIYENSQEGKRVPAPLPNNVVAWLRFKCLAHLASQNHKKVEPGSEEDEKFNVVAEEDQRMVWNRGGRRFEYYGELLHGVLVYMERETEREPEELEWSEEEKAWLSPSLSRSHPEKTKGVTLPTTVGEWLRRIASKVVEKERTAMVCTFRKQWSTSPWTVVPPYIRGTIPQKLDLPTLEADGVLNHSFKNPMLLVEALTHASFPNAVTASCQRLVFIGEPLLEVLITLMLLEGSELPVQSPLLQTEDIGSFSGPMSPHLQRLQHTMAVPWLHGEERRWPRRLAAPETQEERQLRELTDRQPSTSEQWLEEGRKGKGITCAVRRPEHLPRWLRACCNRTAYACAAVRLDLHKHILCDETSRGPDDKTLPEATAEIARRVRRMDKQKDTPINIAGQHAPLEDAPRALGDVLPACAAAVLLDSDWSTASAMLRPLLQRHLLDHVWQHGKADEGLDGAPPGTAPPTWADPLATLQEMAARHGLEVNIEDVQAGAERELIDIHTRRVLIGKNQIRQPQQASSPRSAEHKCCYAALLQDNLEEVMKHLSSLSEDKRQEWWDLQELGKAPTKMMDTAREPPAQSVAPEARKEKVAVEASQNADDSEGDAPEAGQDKEQFPVDNNGNIICIECNMCLNGPQQMKDHRIGKKHRKNVQRARANALSGSGGSPATASPEHKQKQSKTKIGAGGAVATDKAAEPNKPAAERTMGGVKTGMKMAMTSPASSDEIADQAAQPPPPPPPPPIPDDWPHYSPQCMGTDIQQGGSLVDVQPSDYAWGPWPWMYYQGC